MEYGLIVALAALVLIGGVKATGDVLNESFNNQSSNIENSVPKG